MRVDSQRLPGHCDRVLITMMSVQDIRDCFQGRCIGSKMCSDPMDGFVERRGVTRCRDRNNLVEVFLRSRRLEHPRAHPEVHRLIDMAQFGIDPRQRPIGMLRLRLDSERLFVMADCLTDTSGRAQAVGQVPVQAGGVAGHDDRLTIERFSGLIVSFQRCEQPRDFPPIGALRRDLQRLRRIGASLFKLVQMNTDEAHAVQRVRVAWTHRQNLTVTGRRLGHAPRGKMRIGVHHKSVHVRSVVIHEGHGEFLQQIFLLATAVP
nr:hypothetical protein [Paraburkholderia ultramafica]